MPIDDLCFRSAGELAQLVRSKTLSSRELVAAHLDRIERINPRVNAIVTLVAEQALEQARAADESAARGDWWGPLHGLPVVHKDLHETQGIRTTYGSPLFRDHVPTHDCLTVERLKKGGAITLGKTNTPEFGAGSQTYNEVFGATLNPYDRTKTCGGSSGGAAVALACGLAPLADGSDMGGSLRNPASFCNVVGLRPAPGRVPTWPKLSAWSSLAVDGPMGRTVADVARMLAVLAGPDPRSPIAIAESGERFSQPLDRDFKGVNVAWAVDFANLPIDPRVSTAIDDQRSAFESLGCRVEDDQPSFAGADQVFKVLRAWSFELAFGGLLARHRDQLKETVIWNIEEGQKLTGPQIAHAEVQRTELYHRVRRFLERYEFMVLPVSQVPPFDVGQRFITEINGIALDTYIDWMKSCYFISVTGLPAISVPCGFTPEGLPVGVQIVGRHQDEWGLLHFAHAFEQATGVGRRRPEGVG